MRYLNTVQMLTEQIHLYSIVSFRVREPRGFRKTFIGKGRSCHVLVLYLAGKREYTVQKSGARFDLCAGDVLYVPQYAEYGFTITDCGGEAHDDAIALNFYMEDTAGESVCFGDEPRVLTHNCTDRYSFLFERLAQACNGGHTGVMMQKSLLYALVYEILTETRAAETRADPYGVIAPAIRAVEQDPARDISVPLLAKRCGVGETRFRQLFLQYSGGVSFVEYRNRLRIRQAEKLIRTDFVTVEYAARAVGFRDLSHFYRLYKKYNGSTPRKTAEPGTDEKSKEQKC